MRARSMLRRLDLRHVAGNPLDAEEMTSRLDVTQCAWARPAKRVSRCAEPLSSSCLKGISCCVAAPSSPELRKVPYVKMLTHSFQKWAMTVSDSLLTYASQNCRHTVSETRFCSVACCRYTTAIVLCDQSWVDPGAAFVQLTCLKHVFCRGTVLFDGILDASTAMRLLCVYIAVLVIVACCMDAVLLYCNWL